MAAMLITAKLLCTSCSEPSLWTPCSSTSTLDVQLCLLRFVYKVHYTTVHLDCQTLQLEDGLERAYIRPGGSSYEI